MRSHPLQPCNAQQSFPAPDETAKPGFHEAEKSLKAKPKQVARLYPLNLGTPRQQQPENHPHFLQIHESTWDGSRSCPTLEPTEAHGLHIRCRGLWAGGQSTIKTQQLSVHEHWPKRCGSRTRPCQLIRTPQGGKTSRAERVSQEEMFSRALAAFPAPLSCCSEWRGVKSRPAKSPLEAGSHGLPSTCCLLSKSSTPSPKSRRLSPLV